jgi:hypothetical protein
LAHPSAFAVNDTPLHRPLFRFVLCNAIDQSQHIFSLVGIHRGLRIGLQRDHQILFFKPDVKRPLYAASSPNLRPRSGKQIRRASIKSGKSLPEHATAAQIALAWILARKPWIVPIPGTTKLHRFEQNLGAADIELTADDLRDIDAAVLKIDVKGEGYPPFVAAMVDR